VRIAYAMIHAPKVLLLDEPMTGLDIRERFRILRLLDRLRDLVSIIFSTHQPEEAAGICDEILILNRGRAIAYGTPSEIIARATGYVFEASIPFQHFPLENDWQLVSAERDGKYLRVRTVGGSPPMHGPCPLAVFLTNECAQRM
jgi:ABC-type multidrug transport system ATPase subunit